MVGQDLSVLWEDSWRATPTYNKHPRRKADVWKRHLCQMTEAMNPKELGFLPGRSREEKESARSLLPAKG